MRYSTKKPMLKNFDPRRAVGLIVTLSKFVLTSIFERLWQFGYFQMSREWFIDSKSSVLLEIWWRWFQFWTTPGAVSTRQSHLSSSPDFLRSVGPISKRSCVDGQCSGSGGAHSRQRALMSRRVSSARDRREPSLYEHALRHLRSNAQFLKPTKSFKLFDMKKRVRSIIVIRNFLPTDAFYDWKTSVGIYGSYATEKYSS